MEGRSPLQSELLSIRTRVIQAGNQGLGLGQLGASGGQFLFQPQAMSGDGGRLVFDPAAQLAVRRSA